jgi:GrpB-like predicted nucleotidyltransferase (UPF0157 family)
MIEPPSESTRVVGEKIEVRPYDAAWPSQFQQIHNTLATALASLSCRIEHVGSTSVPGLSAKPILDIDIVVESPEGLEAVIEALSGLGYEHQGDLGVSGREAFRCKVDEAGNETSCQGWPAHHLYACIEGGRELRRHLAFRDYLRANQAAAAEYSELKTRLALRYPWDRIRYSKSKDPFVEGVLRELDPTLLLDHS